MSKDTLKYKSSLDELDPETSLYPEITTNHRPCSECVSRTNLEAKCISSSTFKAKYYSDDIVAINNEFLKMAITFNPKMFDFEKFDFVPKMFDFEKLKMVETKLDKESFRENKPNEPAPFMGLGPLTRCKLQSHFICIDPDTGDWCDPPKLTN